MVLQAVAYSAGYPACNLILSLYRVAQKERMFFISARDFFLWGYLKSKVYVRKPRTVDDLKVSIREEIATVPQEMLVNVMQNLRGGSGRVYGKKDAIFPV